mmetsp:Transcript_153779/g.294782  ORF Transcript_153779/g.294782 Transcript_153779/m.294782 type:complete len:395 (-) Transcript_153779:75-1259(-)
MPWRVPEWRVRSGLRALPLTSLIAGAAGQLVCTSRRCLPPDSSSPGSNGAPINVGKLCYQNIGGAEAFARCGDGEGQRCVKCTNTPPCESWCKPQAKNPTPLGEPCHFDHECGTESDNFVACHLGICRVVVWTGQKCDANDIHSVCLYGVQQCIDGVCQGLSTNQACWDGYPAGRDLDCKIGWYCLRGVCVPQLPNGHTCHGEHPFECVRGHHCNLKGDRTRCVKEYALEPGQLSSNRLLCKTAHISPRMGECGVLPDDDIAGNDCRYDWECGRSDGSSGTCTCKQWWDGSGINGFCELHVADLEKPSFMEFRALQISRCHHNWPAERCAAELEEIELVKKVFEESQPTADPTKIDSCAYDILEYYKAWAVELRICVACVAVPVLHALLLTGQL